VNSFQSNECDFDSGNIADGFRLTVRVFWTSKTIKTNVDERTRMKYPNWRLNMMY